MKKNVQRKKFENIFVSLILVVILFSGIYICERVTSTSSAASISETKTVEYAVNIQDN